jgi:hypothetical protein
MHVECSQPKHVGLSSFQATDLGVGKDCAEEALLSHQIVPISSVGAPVPLKVVRIYLGVSCVNIGQRVPEKLYLLLTCLGAALRRIHLIRGYLYSRANYVRDGVLSPTEYILRGYLRDYQSFLCKVERASSQYSHGDVAVLLSFNDFIVTVAIVDDF